MTVYVVVERLPYEGIVDFTIFQNEDEAKDFKLALLDQDMQVCKVEIEERNI